MLLMEGNTPKPAFGFVNRSLYLRGRQFRLVLLIRRPYTLDLPHMLLRMLGINPKQLDQRERSALAVGSRALERLFRLILQQLVIRETQDSKNLQRLGDLALVVIELGRPRFLVPGLHDRIILGDHLAESHYASRLAIRQMAHNLSHAPLAVGLEIEFGSSRAGGRHSQYLRTPAESFQKICEFAHD